MLRILAVMPITDVSFVAKIRAAEMGAWGFERSTYPHRGAVQGKLARLVCAYWCESDTLLTKADVPFPIVASQFCAAL
jgi:hypothetical protein